MNLVIMEKAQTKKKKKTLNPFRSYLCSGVTLDRHVAPLGLLSPFLLRFSHFSLLLFSIWAAPALFTPDPYQLLAGDVQPIFFLSH